MSELEMVLFGMGTIALIAAYFINKIDIKKWSDKHSHE